MNNVGTESHPKEVIEGKYTSIDFTQEELILISTGLETLFHQQDEMKSDIKELIKMIEPYIK